jgi:hypothetical protein
MSRIMSLVVALFLAAALVADARHFRAHDAVGIVANTIGPFNNPTETYPVSPFQIFLAYYGVI